jgi:septum formation protein
MNLVLASSSPRRAMLLESLGLGFTIVAPTVMENHSKELPPSELVEMNSRTKAQSVAARQSPDALVLGADTIVCLEGKILGKPHDLDEARQMLLELSGRCHDVYTGITLIQNKTGTILTDYERTAVTFRDLSVTDIETYLQAVKPLDRAGAYTVEGIGSLLVERFEGCYYNVVGLPLPKLDQMLRAMGESLFVLSHNNVGNR